MSDTLPKLMLAVWNRSPERPSVFWRQGGRWHGRTARQVAERVATLARGLHVLGVARGHRVGVVARTRPEWADVDAAVLALAGVVVGIYPTLRADAVRWQLAHSGAKVVVVEDAEQAAKLEGLDGVEILTMDAVSGLRSLDDIAQEATLEWLAEVSAAVEPNDVATLIYTSGTTGDPKGVALTHGHFAAVIQASLTVGELRDGERGIVWLPLSHVFQRFASYRGAIAGMVGYYARDQEELPEAIAVGRPHVLASVPRMLEKVRGRVLATIEGRPPVSRAIARWAFDVGARRQGLEERGERVPLPLRLQSQLADRLVFRRIRDRLGGSIRMIACGGAALDPEVGRWFAAIGLPVLEGWGLTETCAPATANRLGEVRYGTVGRALPGVELCIAGDGEVLVRGPGVFGGYYLDDAATHEVFTDDGYFRTGDIGVLDAEGYLRITDRKKEIVVTSGGKNIAPAPIENRVMRSPYVSQAVVVGSERPYLVALLVPEEEALTEWAASRGLPEDLPTLLRTAEAKALFDEAVADANSDLERFETIKRHAVLDRAFSVESGELTPTLKLRRRVVVERFAQVIAGLYASP